MFTSVGVHSPLIMDKAANAETEDGYSGSNCYECGENVGSDDPACDEANQPGCQAEDSNALVKLLL